MPFDIRAFQKRYHIPNKGMAEICGCSLPTIQKWRSGEVPVSGAAQRLLRILDLTAEGNPAKLREALLRMDEHIGLELASSDSVVVSSSAGDRMELLLESRRMGQEIAEWESRYRSMVESSANPVCRWLPDTTLTYVNRAYAELYGQPGEDLVGRKWIDFIPEKRRSAIAAIVSDIVRRGQEETTVHESVDRDGSILYQEWKDIPVKDERGKVVEFHSVVHDISSLVLLRREVEFLRRIKASFFNTAGQPILVLDENGHFYEMNDRFRNEILGGADAEDLSDILDATGRARLQRLLQRLSESGGLRYQMRIRGRDYSVAATLLGRIRDQARFLTTFEQLDKTEASPVMQVRLKSESLVNPCANSSDFIRNALRPVEKAMGSLGHALQVDRVYVFTFHDEEDLFDNILEWCASGVEPQIQDLRDIPMAIYPWWIQRLRKGQLIQIEDTRKMPRNADKEQEILLAQKIGAVLVAPIVCQNKTVGFVGLDHNHSPRLWHAQEVEALNDLRKDLERALCPDAGGRNPDQTQEAVQTPR